ncbi:FAD/NAD(P)-binding domain-containing protein [Violaceomyces palustris]|uniref:FAD/NAD(P)-binding domain-containing protein n=1 Tax=Violaceomyces palustris TaxID=1673888 RepID=A0ACD0NXZ6_9BASI|nr:FAD/NAD(P)-binding domain-containing protein [Violaceomyces palustris]
MSQYKNVVIVGASAGGIGAARRLENSLPQTHRIVLIDACEVAFYPTSALRAAVVPGFEKQTIAPLASVFPPNSRHIVLGGTRVIGLGQNHVKLDRTLDGQQSSGDGDEIHFDKAILAIGYQYSFPSRAAGRTEEEILEGFSKVQEDVKRAESILVVGGGPVGVEFAGEVKSAHPGKKVTIVSSSERLIGHLPGLHERLKRQLENLGVELVLGDKISDDDARGLEFGRVFQGGQRPFKTLKGFELSSDLVIDGRGGRPNTSLVSTSYPDAVDERGQIKASRNLVAKCAQLSNYLVVGDANDLPVPKTAFVAQMQGKLAADNVRALVLGGGQDVSKLKEFGNPPSVMMVTLGPKGGASKVYSLTFGEWFTSLIKGKGLFVSQFKANYVAAK